MKLKVLIASLVACIMWLPQDAASGYVEIRELPLRVISGPFQQ
jgi:hypothetical protein